jgi:hypothetical protein
MLHDEFFVGNRDTVQYRKQVSRQVGILSKTTVIGASFVREFVHPTHWRVIVAAFVDIPHTVIAIL